MASTGHNDGQPTSLPIRYGGWVVAVRLGAGPAGGRRPPSPLSSMARPVSAKAATSTTVATDTASAVVGWRLEDLAEPPPASGGRHRPGYAPGRQLSTALRIRGANSALGSRLVILGGEVRR
jgi:hypothetical protein